MKNVKTLYQFILDSSGSMASDRVNTVNMFNRQVATVKSLASEFKDQEFLTGLTVFNSEVNQLFKETPAEKLKELSMERYLPTGSTALYDAIGLTVDRVCENYAKELKNNRMSVVVIILTDGYENSSRRYDMPRIARVIKDLEATEKWSFNILGADFDITSLSSDMNFRSSASMNYSKSDFKYMEEDIEDSLRYYADRKSKGFIDKEFFKRKNR